MNWNNIWNSRTFNINNSYEYNGYQFKNEDEYNKFIFEITKNIKINDNDRILDLGCGNATFINTYLKNNNIYNYKLYGLDFCKKNINYANKNFKGNYLEFDINNNLPYEDNFFDVIICVSTIFYLDNNESANNLIKEIKRVSKQYSNIYFLNCMDLEKKELALEKRKITHKKEAKHLYLSKNFFLDHFKENNIQIIDNIELDLSFYNGNNYKYNIYIENNCKLINIGVDFHDTLSHNPTFFKNLLYNWKGKRVIVTGTPLSKKSEVENALLAIDFSIGKDYDIIECGYEYEKEDMDYTHFNKMKFHKLKCLQRNNIEIYFDDNPYYVNYLKDYNIKVYQVILSKAYIETFKKIDKYFCCNLQENQFNYLNNFEEKKKVYLPGVFDLFHLGHLNILKNAKNICNSYLIVGVQKDESVFKSKNKMPILNTESRIKFIKNLDLCDQIISYENTDQSNILCKFKIDVFVIGPEFGNTLEHKNTLKFCNDNNIEVVKIERTPEISTTEIIEKIKCN